MQINKWDEAPLSGGKNRRFRFLWLLGELPGVKIQDAGV